MRKLSKVREKTERDVISLREGEENSISEKLRGKRILRMRKFDRRRVGSYYDERIESGRENKGSVEVLYRDREESIRVKNFE